MLCAKCHNPILSGEVTLRTTEKHRVVHKSCPQTIGRNAKRIRSEVAAAEEFIARAYKEAKS